MKIRYLLFVTFLFSTFLFPISATAFEKDSVYSWGEWQKGIKPAAGGPAARITPPPAQRPDINFRPNENSAFLRDATQRPNSISGFSSVDTSVPVITTPPPLITTPPPAPPSL